LTSFNSVDLSFKRNIFLLLRDWALNLSFGNKYVTTWSFTKLGQKMWLKYERFVIYHLMVGISFKLSHIIFTTFWRTNKDRNNDTKNAHYTTLLRLEWSNTFFLLAKTYESLFTLDTRSVSTRLHSTRLHS